MSIKHNVEAEIFKLNELYYVLVCTTNQQLIKNTISNLITNLKQKGFIFKVSAATIHTPEKFTISLEIENKMFEFKKTQEEIMEAYRY